MKSALFVDFDNIYSGLRKLDQAAADRFASHPSEWMDWIMRSLALPEFAPEGSRRRVLVRRCYLNPQVYQGFRPYFNKAGFEITDCPALTSGGKTSTDIHMVLDMIDLLQHEAHYDEFIVFSADADFTPVLRKLRRWDRRTTVLAIGFPSAAYRASADLVIDQDEFVRNALHVREREDSRPARPAPASATPPMPMPQPQPQRRQDAVPPPSPAPMLDRITALVRRELEMSPDPVPCARIASIIAHEFSAVAEGWNGNGTFRKFMESLRLEPLVLDWNAAGGHIVDPVRHLPAAKAVEPPDSDWGADEELLAFARQIHDVTGVPLLSPARYRELFDAVAADVGGAGFAFIESGKRVRDRFRELGRPISRADISFVLRGLLLRDHRFGEGNDTPTALARTFANNVRSLCLREQIMLDQATETAIRRWIENGR